MEYCLCLLIGGGERRRRPQKQTSQCVCTCTDALSAGQMEYGSTEKIHPRCQAEREAKLEQLREHEEELQRRQGAAFDFVCFSCCSSGMRNGMTLINRINLPTGGFL